MQLRPLLSPLYATLRDFFAVLVAAGEKWVDDGAPTRGAAIAFYTIFSLGPVVLTILAVAGAVFGAQAVSAAFYGEVADLVGAAGAEAIRRVVEGVHMAGGNALAKVIGPVLFVFGASTVFAELQSALNAIWRSDVAREQAQRRAAMRDKSLIRQVGRVALTFLRVRLTGFALVIAAGFLLTVSLAVNVSIVAFASYIEAYLVRGPAVVGLLWTIELAISITVLTGMFALIFKALPDAHVGWSDVWIGALVTTFLFTVGKFAIGYYFANANVGSGYGAAGTFIVVLLWVYYAAQIFLFGAEVTWLWHTRGRAKKTG